MWQNPIQKGQGDKYIPPPLSQRGLGMCSKIGNWGVTSPGWMWLDLLLKLVRPSASTFSVTLFLYFNLNEKAIELNNVGQI